MVGESFSRLESCNSGASGNCGNLAVVRSLAIARRLVPDGVWNVALIMSLAIVG